MQDKKKGILCYAAYKCPLCGEIKKVGEIGTATHEEIMGIISTVVKSQQFIGTPYIPTIPMQIPHMCQDGSVGLAYFAGFRNAKPTKK